MKPNNNRTTVVVIPIAEALGDPSVPYAASVGSGKELRGIWLGRVGARQVEVCELLQSSEPDIATLRTAWAKRQGRRGVPLIVFWQGSSHVLLTEPTGEPVSVVRMDASAALAVIRRALDAPVREAVQSVLSLIERTQGSGGVAGFRNRNLLSTHYVRDGFRRDHEREWIELDNSGATLRSHRGTQLLRALGFQPTNNPATFQAVYDGRLRVHVMALPEGTSLDRSAAGPGDAPSTRLLVEGREKGAERSIIISGHILRLYLAEGTQAIDDVATAGTYLELDLDILGPEWNAFLPLLFDSRSHRPDGTFDQLLAASKRYAVGLRDRFRRRIYENVVEGIARAIYDVRGRGQPDAALLFHATLRLLFRLLFLLYAEDRNLLPLGNPEYRRKSLTDTLFRIDEIARSGRTFDSRQTTLWDDLFQVFDAIRNGSEEWNIPAYNGGLFDPEVPGHPEATFLQSVKIPNATLAPLLIELAFDSEDDRRGKVDFGDLGVRHLGTLYEGLLAFSIHIADRDLTVDTDGMYVAAGKGDRPIVRAGQPYLTSPKGERKTSGSYYTPSFVVRRLITKALVPSLDTHLARVETLPSDSQWREMLNFHIVDPAMGSGHFLVDALDVTSDRLARFLSDNPRIAAMPIGAAREQITVIGKKYGVEGLGLGVGDFDILRRIVMRNCIYGVDLNPMAVELAKLSLWLHAFVPGLPLSYLGHNLQCGNALVGVVGREIESQMGSQLFGNAVTTALNEALEHAKKLAELSDLSVDQIHESEAAQAHLEEAAEPLLDALNAFACRTFACDERLADKAERHRGRAALEQADGLQRVLEGTLRGIEKHQVAKARTAAESLKALHWQVAFPEVFVRENGGFDVVLGNPPWEEITIEELGFFVPFIPGIKGIQSQEERARLIRALCRARPDVKRSYEDEVQRTEELRALIGDTYELTQGGDPDLYRAFAERSLTVMRRSGAMGMVYPHSLATTDGPAPFRRVAFANHQTVIDFAVNTGGWIFPDVHHQYSMIGFSRAPANEVVSVAGPVHNLQDWESIDDHRVEWTVGDLRKMSGGLEVPRIENADYALLFRKIANNGQAFSEAVDGVVLRPWTEFHGTNDRKSGLLKEQGRGWPVYKGENFDLWTPEIGSPPFVLDPNSGLKALFEKRKRSEVWADFPKSTIADPKTLPPNNCHVMFRDATNRLNARTMIACLVPPGRFATNKAPVLICNGGGDKEVAYRLAIMSSLTFDWLARRRVERNMNFFILNALPVPRVGLADARAVRAMKIAASLACVDKRYSTFAKNCGIIVGSAKGSSKQDRLLAELDALVASLYDLDVNDMRIVLSDFSVASVSEDRRSTTLQFLSEIRDGK